MTKFFLNNLFIFLYYGTIIKLFTFILRSQIFCGFLNVSILFLENKKKNLSTFIIHFMTHFIIQDIQLKWKRELKEKITKITTYNIKSNKKVKYTQNSNIIIENNQRKPQIGSGYPYVIVLIINERNIITIQSALNLVVYFYSYN